MNTQEDLYTHNFYVEAPNYIGAGGLSYPDGKTFKTSIFLAGGITGCPDWQSDMRYMLYDLIIFNPRRENFPIGDPNEALEQITWEHHYLRVADIILFWFPFDTLCPIVLYELGAWSMTEKPIFVGVHPDYKRRQDVEIQTKLARPDITIASSIQELSYNVNQWVKHE